MSGSIRVQKLNDAIQNALESYNQAIVKSLKVNTTRAMKDLVRTTKATAPVGKRSKHYRDSIVSKTLRETRYGISLLWYVKGSDYRLSHLLNNGHALKDGGRYPGTNFIGKATDEVVTKYLAQIEEEIKNG